MQSESYMLTDTAPPHMIFTGTSWRNTHIPELAILIDLDFISVRYTIDFKNDRVVGERNLHTMQAVFLGAHQSELVPLLLHLHMQAATLHSQMATYQRTLRGMNRHATRLLAVYCL